MMDGEVRIAFGSGSLLPAFTAAFNAGFVDYKYGVVMDEAQMVQFVARSGIALEHSAVLLQRQDGAWKGVGVALVAMQDKEAWCSGLAVTPSLRGRGFGRQLMDAIKARVAAAGAATLRLEVLVENEPARCLYARLGYQAQRDLLFWRVDSPFENGSDAYLLHAATVREALGRTFAWQEGAPAWQRTRHAVAHYLDELWAYEMRIEDESAGWILLLPTAPRLAGPPRARIMAMAVRPGAHRKALAHHLLASLRAYQPETVLSVINEPEESIFTGALRANGFSEVDRQMEMILTLI